jgi:CO/xanthine dehydrogenase Mo-binding subunit
MTISRLVHLILGNPVLYYLSFISIIALQFHLVTSIVLQARKNGWRSISRKAFWTRRTGHWSGRIILGETGDMSFRSEKIFSSEEVEQYGNADPTVNVKVPGQEEGNMLAEMGEKMGQGFVLCL